MQNLFRYSKTNSAFGSVGLIPFKFNIQCSCITLATFLNQNSETSHNHLNLFQKQPNNLLQPNSHPIQTKALPQSGDFSAFDAADLTFVKNHGKGSSKYYQNELIDCLKKTYKHHKFSSLLYEIEDSNLKLDLNFFHPVATQLYLIQIDQLMLFLTQLNDDISPNMQRQLYYSLAFSLKKNQFKIIEWIEFLEVTAMDNPSFLSALIQSLSAKEEYFLLVKFYLKLERKGRVWKFNEFFEFLRVIPFIPVHSLSGLFYTKKKFKPADLYSSNQVKEMSRLVWKILLEEWKLNLPLDPTENSSFIALVYMLRISTKLGVATEGYKIVDAFLKLNPNVVLPDEVVCRSMDHFFDAQDYEGAFKEIEKFKPKEDPLLGYRYYIKGLIAHQDLSLARSQFLKLRKEGLKPDLMFYKKILELRNMPKGEMVFYENYMFQDGLYK